MTGSHISDCRHVASWHDASLRRVSRLAFGHEDGPSVARVRQGLDELAANASRVLLVDRTTGQFLRETTTMISWQETGLVPNSPLRRSPRNRYSWTTPIRDSLLEGHFQRLPLNIVRLHGVALRLWIALLVQPRAAKLQPGWRAEFAVTATRPTIRLDRLGLSETSRPAKIGRASLGRWLAIGAKTHGKPSWPHAQKAG